MAVHSAKVQIAAVEKFLSIGYGTLRGVVDKGRWFERCLCFCARTSLAKPPEVGGSPAARLISALHYHALLPDDLSKDYWEMYRSMPPDLQERVADAVQKSTFTNVTDKMVSEHFANICSNERAILEITSGAPPVLLQRPQQQSMESIDGTLYKRLLRGMLFDRRRSEELLLRELGNPSLEVRAGAEGSLLLVHVSTSEARMEGEADVLSLLHAAAATGLVRVCARFIAEGLDVNERAGRQQTTPLHLAASKGEVGVVELLLRMQADPSSVDGAGHSVLRCAVAAAAELQDQQGSCGMTAGGTSVSQQFKVCSLLLIAGAEDTTGGDGVDGEKIQGAEEMIERHNLTGMQKLFHLHRRLRSLKEKVAIDEACVAELCELQFETAMLVIHVFHRYLSPSPAAAATEFRAFVASDYIQERNKIQMMGNRLAKKLGLKKRAVDVIVALPPEAARLALSTLKVEETQPKVYDISYELNPHLQRPADELDDGGAEEVAQPHNSTARDPPPSVRKIMEDSANRYTGRVRKWDSERGFGFAVQDPKDGEEGCKDIFVHRKNIVGSTPTNHIDLKEGGKISYRLGDQEGRPRALEAAMIDEHGGFLPIHLQKSEKESGRVGRDEVSDGGGSESELNFTRATIRHVRMSRDVQECAKEKRVDLDAWFRCTGLRRHGSNRRDDALWKREVDRRVEFFLEKSTSPLQKRDFDFRVKRFMLEFCVQSSVGKVSETLAMLEDLTVGKSRDAVRSWPAYLATLLRRSDPKLYESLADRDRRDRRSDEKIKEEPSPSTALSNGYAAEPAREASEAGDSSDAYSEEFEAPAPESRPVPAPEQPHDTAAVRRSFQ
mmetsp:Transcript_74257/g.207440  ORF Transcript_74257/g.207440 Transcript_74257/m.207440 type:complete len:838 (+) Transcript_74257:862-3375(+)